MDDLAAMRKASRKTTSLTCAACELEAEMTPEQFDTFRKSYDAKGVNTAGQLWWVAERFPDARVLTLKEPAQCIRPSRGAHGR